MAKSKKKTRKEELQNAIIDLVITVLIFVLTYIFARKYGVDGEYVTGFLAGCIAVMVTNRG